MRQDVLDALSGVVPSRIPTPASFAACPASIPGNVPPTRSSSGGLHGDVPMENLVAYFETRDRMGIPAEV